MEELKQANLCLILVAGTPGSHEHVVFSSLVYVYVSVSVSHSDHHFLHALPLLGERNFKLAVLHFVHACAWHGMAKAAAHRHLDREGHTFCHSLPPLAT